MATKPEFLVAKEKMLVALATILVAILSSAKAAFIMYTAGGKGGGGRGYFLNGQDFLKSPPYHTEFLHSPAFDQGDSLEHVDSAIHCLEKQSVVDVDVDVDDVK